MPIINRISRLFTADLHAVLDRIEEPEVLLRQALREMEEEVSRGEGRAAALRRERDQWVARDADVARDLADLDEQLDLCFAADEDALARSLIRRKLEMERIARHVRERRDVLEVSLAEHETDLAERRETLATLREKAELVTETPRASEPPGRGPGVRPIGEDEVDVAFLREKQRRSAP